MDQSNDKNSTCSSLSSEKKKFIFWLLSLMLASCIVLAIPVRYPRSKLSDITRLWITNPKQVSSPDEYHDLPSKEIAIPYFTQSKDRRFSKFRCTGSENNFAAYEGRLCVFYNLCYQPATEKFYYYHLSEEQKRPLFYDASMGMLYELNNNTETGFVSLSAAGSTPWSPIVTNETYPTESVVTLRQVHFLTTIRLAGDNIAHGLWEDFGSISYSMERMNIIDSDLVIMHLGPVTHHTLTDLYNEYIIPVLSPHPISELQSYTSAFGFEHVCFKQIIAGGQLSVFRRELIRENHGREALFYNWRSKIIKYHGFDPNFVPKQHHIIITNKSHSIWTHRGSKRHRAIVNLEEVAQFVQQTYPNITSEVVEWHKIPFNQQVQKLLSTTIFITPCGGVSLILPFLPHGAHAIVMDYYANQDGHGYRAGDSGSMEGAFLNHIAHVRKQYYQLYGSDDFEFDFRGASNSREDASVIVNMTRLDILIKKALEEMKP